MQDADRETGEAAERTDGPETSPDTERPTDDAQPERMPSRRPVRALGAVGCLTMALAAVAGMALLATGNFFAGVAGILIVAVASGVGLWLSAVASLKKK